MLATNTPLVAVELIAASVWVGGMVCLALVAAVAREVLDEASQVRFFRLVGRRYGVLGTTALLVAIAAGLALSWPSLSSSRTIDAALSLAVVLFMATILGMRQARAMTTLRRRMITNPTEGAVVNAVQRGRRWATAIRGLMALITLAIIILAAWIMTH